MVLQGKEPPAQTDKVPEAAEQAEAPASDAPQDKYAVMNELLPDLAMYVRAADVSLDMDEDTEVIMEMDEETESALQADTAPA